MSGASRRISPPASPVTSAHAPGSDDGMRGVAPRTWPCSPRSRSRPSRRRARATACSRRRRRSSRRSGRSRSGGAARAATAGAAERAAARPRACRGGRRRSARGSTARSRPACGRRCRCPAGTSIRSSCSSGTPSRAQLGEHAGAALGAGDEADVGHARLEPAPQRVQLVPPVRRDDEREIARRAAPGAAVHGDEVEPELRAERRTAAAIGVSPTTRTRGAGSTGSRKISIAPPDRHGFCTVTAPSSIGDLPAARGLRRSARRERSAAAPPPRSRSPSARTRARCARAHTPPTNPSIVPSPSTSATSPALHARRALRAHDRGGHERRALLRRAPAPAATWRRSSLRRLGRAPASPPTRAPGCRACRCGRRRASRTARR